MRRCRVRLVWLLGPAGFPEGPREKSGLEWAVASRSRPREGGKRRSACFSRRGMQENRDVAVLSITVVDVVLSTVPSFAHHVVGNTQ